MVDGAPEVVHLAADLRYHLVKMPSPMAKASHATDPLAANFGGKQRADPVPPEPNGFVADINAALEQQILHIPEAEGEPDVHHHRPADHLGR